jgi:hypothetical protein
MVKPVPIVEIDAVWIGYLGLQDSIETFVASLPGLFREFPWAVISCIDGGRGTWLTNNFVETNLANGWNMPHRVLSDGCVAVSGVDYCKLAASGRFFGGYEEAWFYDVLPPSGPPDGVATMLTLPSILTDAGQQKAVATWVSSSNCLLGIGDGIGIVYATPDKSLSDKFVSLVGPEGIIS